MCTNTSKGTKRRWQNVIVTSRPTTAQTIKLLKKTVKEDVMNAKIMMEFERDYDDIEIALDIHDDAVENFQETNTDTREQKDGKTTSPW